MGDDDGRTTSKPFSGPNGQTFEDFDACVRTFEDEDGIDDPEAFCGWLQEEGKDALSDPNAEEVLTTLEVEFVSPVDEPAQDSEWLIAKDAEGPDGETHRWQSEATLYVRKDRDDVKQVAFAPVLIPEEADKQGDVIPTPAIEDAAHKYLAEYRKVDSDHDLRDGKGKPVESWTLKQETTFDLPDGSESREYPAGTWVMGIKFDDTTWERVVSGDLNGLSIYGGAKPVDVDALLGDRNKASHMKSDDDETADSCDITPGPTGTVKSEDAVPEWFERAFKRDEDPCWENYVMVGMKPDPNGDGQVPNCVPEEDADEPDLMGSADMSVVDAWNEHIKMANEDDDPGDTGNDDGDESVHKQDLTADAVSGMLSEFRSMVEDGSLSQGASVEDFVRGLIDAGNIDESSITGLSMFLGGGSEPEADSSDEEMSDDADGDDDDGIDLDADKSDGAGDADGGDDGDVDKSDDDDGVEKSVGTDDGSFDDAPEWAKALKSEVDDLRDKVEDPPNADRMSNADDLSDRIVKDIAGVDDPDVARKAIREQVEKSGEAVDGVDYDGITDGEDADASASESSAAHSAAANTRMVGGDN